MVHMSVIEARLSKLGFKITRLFKPEIKELQQILMDHEKIVTLSQGRYFGGYALLVATDLRILLIDKKMLFLTVEDIRYDMISEIDYSARLLDASVSIFTVNKQHKFTSYKNKHHLRQLTSYAQRRIMELRQYPHQDSFQLQNNQMQQPMASFQPSQQHQVAQPYQSQLPPQPTTPSLPEPSKQLSQGVSQIMGAAALRASTNSWVNFNPYTKGSLSTRRQWSGSWSSNNYKVLEPS